MCQPKYYFSISRLLRKHVSGTFARYGSLSNILERRIVVAEISRALLVWQKTEESWIPLQI